MRRSAIVKVKGVPSFFIPGSPSSSVSKSFRQVHQEARERKKNCELTIEEE
ncbi:Hypothetical protein FKW44_004334 [Caligus rogercresseyi]|uniref:Uncharacterized protein n=1 Tax=Caligus rogercresseyi TaxID=217165 RepID=A0A7T8HLF6_CALRO|nr:Hypothetical protein FKW44_004334 [Caligus rogercresseyi]